MTVNTTPPKLSRPTYWAWLADPDDREGDPTPHLVIVNAGDQLRAELEAKRHNVGSGKDNPMHLSALWLWAALVRTERYGDKFAAFKDDLVAWDAVEDDDQAAELGGGTVTPTAASSS